MRLVLPLMLAVGCADVPVGSTLQAERAESRCSGLARAFAAAEVKALPSLASQLTDGGCSLAAACDQALGELLPLGDSPSLSEAIARLGCLAPAGDEAINAPPPLPDGFRFDPEKPPVLYTSPTLQNGLPVVRAPDGTWVPLGTGTASFILPDGSRFAASVGMRIGPLNQIQMMVGGPGLYRTSDGGGHWNFASGAGSGLEATNQNVSALLSTITPNSTRDYLVGITGLTSGGVYLSGDDGEDWTQINQGFDPNSLNITTFAKTSCSGCPVQYYSGTYGSGVFTRTIAVTAPPYITGWCFGSTSCVCNSDAPSGTASGGQPFKLCGGNFQAGARVQFGVEFARIGAHGCTTVNASSITCTGTPTAAGSLPFRVLNWDTRAGTAAQSYSFL